MPGVKDGDNAGQSYKLSEGHPIMPENVVLFYRDYIPYRTRGDQAREQRAMEALESSRCSAPSRGRKRPS